MELRHLRYFVAVASEQNVTRAAAQLRVAQPSLSRQIRDLESELGFALFEHGARALHLTAAGRTFLDEARIVLQRAEAAVKTARAVAEGARGEVRLGYAPSLTVHILPPALRVFEESFPGVRVHLHELSTREMFDGLRGGTLDLILLPHMSAKAMAGLMFQELERHAVCVAVHPGHPLARARKVGLERVANERLIAFTLADYPEYHAWIAGLFAPFPHPPQSVEEHDGVSSLIAAVEAGRGVALVSQHLECMASPRLTIRPLSPPPPPFMVGVAWRKEAVSPTAENFVATLLQLRKANALPAMHAAPSPARL